VNQLFGEEDIIMKRDYHYTTQVVSSEAKVFRIDRQEFESILQDYPYIQVLMEQRVKKKLQFYDRKLEERQEVDKKLQ
jgi:CRP-like cAMP-binding protein